MKATLTHTRYSIPSALTANGVDYTTTTDQTGCLRYVINGETLTPGEAAERYDTLGLSPYSKRNGR